MELHGQFLLNPEIIGYRISHRVRTRVPGSFPTYAAVGDQRISETSSELAPRSWRTLWASAMSLHGYSHLAVPTSRNDNRYGYRLRRNGCATSDRPDDETTSIVHQRDDSMADVAHDRSAHEVGKSTPRNGVRGHRDDGDRQTFGIGVTRLTRAWRCVLLPATWRSTRGGLDSINNSRALPLCLGHYSRGRWADGLYWIGLPALFQTVDHPIRTVSRRRHDRHARNSGNPMKRGTKYGFSLRGLKAGDSNAWSWLVAEFSGKLVGYATRMGARDPEEVMSATLETIASRIADFEGNESQMRSFIFSIAHARIVDDLRRTTRRTEISIENTLNLLEADEPNEDTFTDPDLLDALGRLPEEQRRMLELRYVMGLSTKETADAIGKSEVATRVGLSRAFARLKDLLIDDLRVDAGQEVSS